MRVVYLTAGAGGMYCGSCMRDNTLVAALRRQGRDVKLFPLYSPIRTDEENVSEDRVYYGGINIYLEEKSAFFRHTPWIVDRMLNSPALLRRAMNMGSSASPESLGALTVSLLRGEDGPQRKELDKLIAGLADDRPDIVHLPDIMFVGLAEQLSRRLGAKIVCTLTGEDIFLNKLPPNFRAEAIELIRRSAADVHGYIAVTKYYAGYAIEEFGLRKDRVHHVPLGVKIEYESQSEKMSFTPGSDVFTIGYFARICPEKGLHLLCEAFSILRSQGRDCRLKIGGYLDKGDRAYFDGIKQHMKAQGLEPFIEYDGEQDRDGKLRFLRSLDVLSVPTPYREAKGLYVLEAMSQAVPVVQPRHGSFPELIEATGGGILVNPEDPADLASGIAKLMDDPDLCHQLGSAGHGAVSSKFTDEVMARNAWAVFETVART